MLRFENSENGRYYYIQYYRDLLQQLTLSVIRGGKRNSLIQHIIFNDPEALAKKVNQLVKLRLKNGYKLIIR